RCASASPYPTLFRSGDCGGGMCQTDGVGCADGADRSGNTTKKNRYSVDAVIIGDGILDYGCRCQYSIWLVDGRVSTIGSVMPMRSEEHTSDLQSRLE